MDFVCWDPTRRLTRFRVHVFSWPWTRTVAARGEQYNLQNFTFGQSFCAFSCTKQCQIACFAKSQPVWSKRTASKFLTECCAFNVAYSCVKAFNEAGAALGEFKCKNVMFLWRLQGDSYLQHRSRATSPKLWPGRSTEWAIWWGDK